MRPEVGKNFTLKLQDFERAFARGYPNFPDVFCAVLETYVTEKQFKVGFRVCGVCERAGCAGVRGVAGGCGRAGGAGECVCGYGCVCGFEWVCGCVVCAFVHLSFV